MSRWTSEFTQHPFQASWTKLKNLLAITEVDDQTVPTSVDELARLKRVVDYLDKIIIAIDPDITPKSVWANSHPQAESCVQLLVAYGINKNITNIMQANDHVDNLLTYLRPYIVLPNEVMRGLRSSAKTYVSELENYTATFFLKSENIIKELEINLEKAKSNLVNIETNSTKINTFASELFIGTDEFSSMEAAINETKELIEKQALEINNLHDELIVGDTSTKAVTLAASVSITENKNKIEGWLNTVNGQIKQLGNFHTKIFGEKINETDAPTGGLEQELKARTTQLALLETNQATKHEALFTKIESLLPGATSAGLASSYKELKDKFTNPIKLYTLAFYGSLLLLVFAAIVMSIQRITFSPEVVIQFVEVKEWDYILKALLYKIPFIAPVLWLAIFSSTRRSQYERLQQEYAHKEALATSYESYKKQIQDLKGDSDELQKELISKAISAIAYNASVTLDGKHEDKMPMQQLLEKFSVDDMKRLVELVKKA